MVVMWMGSCILFLRLNKKNNDNRNSSHSLNTYYISNIELSKHFELTVI